MERFREEVVTAEDQEQRVKLTGKFEQDAFLVLSRHEARMRQFYSFNRTIDNDHASATQSVEGTASATDIRI